ncbi:MAG: hypothetical protein QM763_21455 [Agriterribacter sp.]
MSFKQKVYSHCTELLNEKVNTLQLALYELTQSAANETKSTAGDKHETALAMLQLEQENISRQLKAVLDQKAILEGIDPSIKSLRIGNGSLVKTDNGFLFLSVALGKIIVEDIQVIALSSQSPLGKKLMGLKRNDYTDIKGRVYAVETIE